MRGVYQIKRLADVLIGSTYPVPGRRDATQPLSVTADSSLVGVV
jgi:hypothetical protein